MTQAYQMAGPPRFAHQRQALTKMIQTGGVTALLCDPGTGKTAVTLDYAGLLALKSLSGEARVLVVCPLAAVDTWVTQAEKFVSPQVHFWAESIGGGLVERAEALASRGGNPFKFRPRARQGAWQPAEDPKSAPRALHHRKAWAWAARASETRSAPLTPSEGPDGLGTDKPRLVLEIVNIDTFASRLPHDGGTMADLMLDAVKRFAPDLLVVDESHKIKSVNGNASRLLARMTPHVKRRVILTGTVMPHSPLDVFGQWRFLDPYAFGTPQPDGSVKQATYGAFKGRFAIQGGYMGWEVIGYRNLDEMQQIMARNAIVVRKDDALDLPPTMDVEVPVNLSPKETKAYAEMKAQLAAILGNGQVATVPNRLSQMLRLRQITSGHLPDDNGMLHEIGESKVQVIRSIVHDTLAGEKRVVVFCLFSHEIEVLCRVLAAKGTEIMRIEGGTDQDERVAMRQRFGSDDPARIVMVCQIKTMSLAVNELVTASNAVFGSLSQQRDDLIQARDRLHRIGQVNHKVTFWYAIAPGTVDEVILRAHQDRTNLEDAMLKHIKGEG